MSDMEALRGEIKDFRRRYDLTPDEFGKRARVGTHFVADIDAGRKCRAETIVKVRTFMETYQHVPKSRGTRTAEKYAEAVRLNALAEQEKREFRLSDPVERAKTFIRKEGWVCFEASVLFPEHHGKFVIGRNDQIYTREELLDFARRKGLED